MEHAGSRPETIREGLIAEHARIEVLLDRVIDATEQGDEPRAVAAWRAFESAMRAQLDFEDAHLVCLLPHSRSARILSHEHGYMRGRLGELADAEGRSGRVGALTDLRDILRAHAQNDDRLLYRWAEDELDHGQRTAVLVALAERLAQLDVLVASSDSIVATNSATFTGLVR